MKKKKMVIISNYSYAGEGYSLFGPQIAATVIQDYSDYECVVLAIGREFDNEIVKKMIYSLVGSSEPIIGFSHLAERRELWQLAGELKEEGAITILGGPQADVDYLGEVGWQYYDHRFRGVSDSFTFAIEGPVEQIIPFLTSKQNLDNVNGLIIKDKGEFKSNERTRWDEKYLKKVNWENLYYVGSQGLEQVAITNAQVLHQIGCPYSAKKVNVEIDYPSNLHNEPFTQNGSITIESCGCSFCDVARDKGIAVRISLDAVFEQISLLPEDADGRKIPFELINENPFPFLVDILTGVKQRGIRISQINLVTRADWLLKGEGRLREALNLCELLNVRFLISGIGFESFSDRILHNLNKGYLADVNLAAVSLLRKLKGEYTDSFLYKPTEGAIHGFIHPTPWDNGDTKRELYKNIYIYDLERDILPSASIPLVIHHASWLADWIRELEKRENLKINRSGPLIEWW